MEQVRKEYGHMLALLPRIESIVSACGTSLQQLEQQSVRNEEPYMQLKENVRKNNTLDAGEKKKGSQSHSRLGESNQHENEMDDDD